jgi:hypothetical protein
MGTDEYGRSTVTHQKVVINSVDSREIVDTSQRIQTISLLKAILGKAKFVDAETLKGLSLLGRPFSISIIIAQIQVIYL